MPPLKRWVQFIGSAGAIVGAGLLFVKYGTPSDEQFLNELSPELKAKYLREKDMRAKADLLMQKRIEETKDKPAWLQGSDAMRKLDREVADAARLAMEEEEAQRHLESEKLRLKELAEKEKRM